MNFVESSEETLAEVEPVFSFPLPKFPMTDAFTRQDMPDFSGSFPDCLEGSDFILGC